MAASEMEASVDIKNGLLSFSNPNYHLDDAVNCNTESTDDPYENLYQELDSVCNFKRRSSAKNRRNYAALDIGSMGINIANDPVCSSTTAAAATTATTNTSLENQPLIVTGDNTNRNTGRHLTSSTSVGMGASCDVTDNEQANSMLALDQTGNNGFFDYLITVDSWNQQLSANRPDLIGDAAGDCAQGVALSSDDDGGLGNRLKVDNSPEECSSCNDTGSSSMELNSPDSMLDVGSGGSANASTTSDAIVIPHVPGQLNNDLYAVLVKPRSKSGELSRPTSKPTTPTEDQKDKDTSSPEALPPGWEKHEDNDGPYYWHIKSGTIQREAPPPLPANYKEVKNIIPKDNDIASRLTGPVATPNNRSISTALVVSLPQADSRPDHKDDYKRKSYPRTELENKEKPIRFAVRSLGWVEIAEEDLTPERSSKAVNKCIVDLSLGRNDILDVVGRWGDGKDLFMDLDDSSLSLIDPENLTVLNTQPIHTIRVWGVGRDNGRDFAYVARDRVTRKHMCHVFRCDTPARTIANTLRDICKKIMIERSLTQSFGKPVDCQNRNGGGGNVLSSTSSLSSCSSTSSSARNGIARPTNLPTEHRRFQSRGTTTTYSAQSFPTPMEEPKKILKVHYVGMTHVSKPSGMDVLNAAVEDMTSTVPMDKWQFVNVAVAPSTITISEPGDEGKQLVECRVRFLSFLGIGKNVKHCAFIMHTAQDQFVAHVFHCEPSSGALCKTIEAACKLRYQKCLDAHPPGADRRLSEQQIGRGLGAALKNVLGSLTGRRTKSTDS